MKIFLDTEFTALRQSSELISLALAAETGPWFYAEFTGYDATVLSDWHREHVLPHLFLSRTGALPEWTTGQGTSLLGTRVEIAPAVQQWLAQFEQIEIWADAPAYDWVLFCELLGGSLALPQHIFYLPFDLVTLLKVQGRDPNVQREELAPEWAAQHQGAKHNALYDAFLLREVYRKIGIKI